MLGSFQQISRKSEGLVDLEISVLGSTQHESYNASGVSIAELLLLRHNASYSGRLKCLDGICDSGRYFWQLRVNGRLIPQGVQQYKLSPGDTINLNFTSK